MSPPDRARLLRLVADAKKRRRKADNGSERSVKQKSSSSGDAQPPAAPPPMSRGHWSEAEHAKFVAALAVHGRDWVKVAYAVGSRTLAQVRSHAQKHFLKQKDLANAPRGSGDPARAAIIARGRRIASVSDAPIPSFSRRRPTPPRERPRPSSRDRARTSSSSRARARVPFAPRVARCRRDVGSSSAARATAGTARPEHRSIDRSVAARPTPSSAVARSVVRCVYFSTDGRGGVYTTMTRGHQSSI